MLEVNVVQFIGSSIRQDSGALISSPLLCKDFVKIQKACGQSLLGCSDYKEETLTLAEKHFSQGYVWTDWGKKAESQSTEGTVRSLLAISFLLFSHTQMTWFWPHGICSVWPRCSPGSLAALSSCWLASSFPILQGLEKWRQRSQIQPGEVLYLASSTFRPNFGYK